MNQKHAKNNCVVFVGCSGYGNIGDDTYPLVIKKHLKNYALLFKNSDPDRYLPKDCGLLVIGPGGVIYQNNETAHFDYMKEYMDQAIKREIPLVFLSCGVQKTDIEPWKPYFDYAKLITVRSKKDVEYIKNVTENENVYYFPDLCYLFDEYEAVQELPSKYTVFVPTGKNPSETTKNIISSIPEKERVFLRMGAPKETEESYKNYKALFSGKIILDVSPAKVNYIIKNAEKVFTWRYHGLVFSRINAVPYSTGSVKTLKILHEDRESNTDQAIGHINKLKDVLVKYIDMRTKRIAIIHDDFSLSGGGEKLVSILAERLNKKNIHTEIYTFNVSENTKKMIPKNQIINRLKTKNVRFDDDTIKRYLFSRLSLKEEFDFFIFSGHSSLCAARINKPNILYCHNIPKSEPSFRDIEIEGEEHTLADPNKMIVKNDDDIQIYFEKIKDTHPIEKAWRKLFDLKMKYFEKPILPDSIARKVDAIRFLISRKVPIKDYKFIAYQSTQKENISQVGYILVNSSNTQQKVLHAYKRTSEVVYPPIETEKYSYKEHGDYWVSVNRVVPLKRIELQLKAFAKLPNEKLIIIGSIENKDYYNYLLKIKPKNVTFLGMLTDEEKIKKLSSCRGFIFTAKDEDFGMSPVEAMASGKPVIAANEGGCKETIIHEKTGFLIDDIDDQKLFEAIAKTNLCFDKDLNYFKNACLEQAKKFDVNLFVDKIENIIKERMEKSH